MTPPPVDLEALRAELAEVGAEAVLDEVLDAYIADARNRIDAVVDAVESGDPESVARAAHAYKSSAGQVGAGRLHELLQALEDTAREGRLDAVRRRLEQVQSEHARVLDWLVARRDGADN